MPTDREIVLAARLRLPQHVVHRSFEYDTIVLNLETGTYHGLNSTAGRMLEVVNEAPTVRSAAEIIAAEYEQDLDPIIRDLATFLEDLLDRGLVEIVKEE